MLYQSVHVLCNLLVCDLSVDLRAGNGGVSHHFGDALNRYTSLQSQRAEAMSANMVGQRSANATRQTYGFKAGNKFAFAYRIGEYLVIPLAFLLCVKGKYLLRYRV